MQLGYTRRTCKKGRSGTPLSLQTFPRTKLTPPSPQASTCPKPSNSAPTATTPSACKTTPSTSPRQTSLSAVRPSAVPRPIPVPRRRPTLRLSRRCLFWWVRRRRKLGGCGQLDGMYMEVANGKRWIEHLRELWVEHCMKLRIRQRMAAFSRLPGHSRGGAMSILSLSRFELFFFLFAHACLYTVYIQTIKPGAFPSSSVSFFASTIQFSVSIHVPPSPPGLENPNIFISASLTTIQNPP